MKTEIAKSMQLKHDKQLEDELRMAFINNGSKCDSIQIERRRGKIKVRFVDGELNLIRNTVCAMFPEFCMNEIENGYIIFKEVITL